MEGIVDIAQFLGLFLSVFAIGAFLSLVVMIPIITLAHKSGFVDLPDSRRIHMIPVPRVGGLAVFMSTQVVLGLMFLIPVFPSPKLMTANWWMASILGSSFILVVGVIDDLFGLSASRKLLGQIVAGGLIYLFGVRVELLFGFPLPAGVDFFVTVLWILFVVNAFNLIDGMDGLATGLAIIAALGLLGSVLARGLVFESAVLTGFIGALCGFLYWNKFPAKAFLGDCGSHFIGFFLASAMITAGAKGTTLTFMWVPALALGIPIFDLFLAVWRRSTRYALAHLLGRKPQGGIMSADLQHLHHRVMRLGLSHQDVTATLCLANALLVLVSLVVLPSVTTMWGIFALALGLGFYIVLKFLPIDEFWESALFIFHWLGRPARPVLALVAFLLFDAVSLGLALFVSIRLAHPDLGFSTICKYWIYSIPSWVGITLFAILCVETYNRMWRATRGRKLGLSALVGIASVLFLSESLIVASTISANAALRRSILFFAFSFLLVGGGRVVLRLVERAVLIRVKRHLPNSFETEIIENNVLNLGFYSRMWEATHISNQKVSYVAFGNEDHGQKPELTRESIEFGDGPDGKSL